MKSTNKYINILNILSFVFILIPTLIQDFIIYMNTLNVIVVMYYVISGLNIIIAIINLVKNTANDLVGFINMLRPVLLTLVI